MNDQSDDEMTWLRAFLQALGMLLAIAAGIGVVAGGAKFALDRFGPAGALAIVSVVFAAMFLAVMTVIIKFDMSTGRMFRAPPPPYIPPPVPYSATPDALSTPPAAADVHGNPSRTTPPGAKIS